MGRKITDKELRGLLKAPGVHWVAPGLYVRVRGTEAAWWMYRYMRAGKAHELSLGPVYAKPLAVARAEAAALRVARLGGADPALERAKSKSVPTFEALSKDYIAAHRAGWRSAKHAAQWESTLATYAWPRIGSLPVDGVLTDHVLAVLQADDFWRAKPETANRLRGRIELVLDYAAAKKLRPGDNPARWRGHLDKLLPARSKVARVVHHAALPYDDLPVFMQALRGAPGEAAKALELLILTAARSGEIRGATWNEINLDARLWTIPADRMKAGKEHRVALSDAAVALLRALQRRGDFVFPGRDPKRPISDMTLTAVLRRMGRGDLTAHGFRSTFRDWAAERTNYAAELAEMALAHAVPSKVEAAYRRGDMLTKRYALMHAWADFAAGK